MNLQPEKTGRYTNNYWRSQAGISIIDVHLHGLNKHNLISILIKFLQVYLGSFSMNKQEINKHCKKIIILRTN
jgi:hypothetical protein